MYNYRTLFKRILSYLSLLVLMIFIVSPVLWLAINSISTKKQITGSTFSWFPKEPTIINYVSVLFENTNATAYIGSLLNSIITASITALVCLVLGSFAAYAFARLSFPFRDHFILFILFTQMVPAIAILIPIYIIFMNANMLDSKAAVILAQIAFNLPFIIWIMRSFFHSIPKELEEAASLDGLGRFGILIRIVLPISTPGLFATGTFAFLNSWNDFLTPLILTSTTNSKTMPVVINEFLGRFSIDYGLLSAAGIIGLLPPIIIALLFQKFLVQGLTAGSIK